MILLISHSIPGKEYLKREKISARVRKIMSLNNNYNIELLEKNRMKRPSLEECLNHPWFSDFKDIHQMRLNSNPVTNESKFSMYTLTEPNSPKIREEIEKYAGE